MGEFAGEPFGPAWEVPDPYGQSAEVYRSTGEALRRALERVAQRLAEGRIMEKRGVSGLKVAFGCDHAGIDLREPIRSVVEELGHSFLDFGPKAAESVDYPDFGAKVARAVASGEADLGIVVLTNGEPVGVPEAVAARFTDIAQFGAERQDWLTLYHQRMVRASQPFGDLVDQLLAAGSGRA